MEDNQALFELERSMRPSFRPFPTGFTRPDQMLYGRVCRNGAVGTENKPGTAVHIQQIEHKMSDILLAAGSLTVDR